MNTSHAANIEAIKAEILVQLNCDLNHPPMHVDAKLAALALGVQANTLAAWRSNGRYKLPYNRAGRCIRYRVTDLAEFIASRTACNTGEAK